MNLGVLKTYLNQILNVLQSIFLRLVRKVNVKLLFLLHLFLFIYACDYSPRCIDAEDFGQPKGSPSIHGHNVESRYGEDSDFSYLEKTWSTYTGFVLTGDPLEVRVEGAWSPWSKEALEQGVCGVGARGDDAVYYGKVCTVAGDFVNETMPASAGSLEGMRFTSDIDCGGETNPNICWFPHGLGVYIGLSNDPRNSTEILYHLITNYTSGHHMFTLTQAEVDEVKQQLGVTSWRSVKIYLRIHDNFYEDNESGCIEVDNEGKAIANPTHNQIRPCDTPMDITFVSGARAEEAGFLENAARVFMDPAEDFIYTSYHALVTSDNYKNILNLVWALFFTFMGVGYFAAFIQVSKGELMSVFIRFGIIYTLLSPTSWEFFNFYIVEGFWGATTTMANMVLESFNESIFGSSQIEFSIGQTIDSNILQNVDDIMAMFVSDPVNSKIMALLFSHELGWLLIIALYFAFFVFIMSMVKLTVIFIFVFLTLTILLSLAPIFIIFAVFKYTRNSYFQQWLQALFGAAIQPMMLFVFVGLFLTIISSFLYEMLYYQVCWQSLINLVIFDIEFWKITEVYNYNAGGDPVSTGGTRPNISLVSIFVLFLSALLIRYVTDMVPKIADKIAGGISLEDTTTQTLKMVEYFAEEMGKSTLKGVYKRVRNKTISKLADKVLPTSLSKYVGGTKSRKLEKARKAVRKQMRKKGWTDKQIEQGFKSGDLNSKLRDHFAYERAKDNKYGRKSLNPIKVMQGAVKGAMDNMKISMQKATMRAQGKKLTKSAERKLKKNLLRADIAKAKEEKVGGLGTGKRLDKYVDEFMARQGGDNDLRKTIRDLKDSGQDFKDMDSLRDAIHEKMADKGYDGDIVDNLIDKDLSAGEDRSGYEKAYDFMFTRKAAYSRINSEFGKLPDSSGGGESSSNSGSNSGNNNIPVNFSQAQEPSANNAGGGNDNKGGGDADGGNNANVDGGDDNKGGGNNVNADDGELDGEVMRNLFGDGGDGDGGNVDGGDGNDNKDGDRQPAQNANNNQNNDQ